MVLLVSCGHFADRSPAQQEVINSSFEIEENLRMEIEQFQGVVEEALVWRSRALEFTDRNKEKFKKENFLSIKAFG